MLLSLHLFSIWKNPVNVSADGNEWLRTPDLSGTPESKNQEPRTTHILQASHYADTEHTIARVSQINKNKGRKHALMQQIRYTCRDKLRHLIFVGIEAQTVG